METKLLELFEGDSNQHIEVTITGDLDARGKRAAEYKTVYKPVTAELWKRHLSGEIIIGVKPEIEGKAKWGCIDMDPSSYTDFSSKKFIDIIKHNQLPLVPVRSKSGGLHLMLFLKDWSDEKQIRQVLDKWNEKYFMAKEVFPRNKHLGMPYHRQERTIEYAFDDNGTALLVGGFIDIAYKKRMTIEELLEFKTQKYEPEPDWNEYPPCIQNLLTDKWTGTNRNDIMFNMAVLEMKKSDGNIDKKTLTTTLFERNKQIFTDPLTEREIVGSVANSTAKKSYNYKCPPRYGHMTSICNKQLCQMRKLGIGFQVPDVIDEFDNVLVTKGIKETFIEFKYKGVKMTFKTDQDLVDERAFRTKMLSYGIMWMTLPKPKKGPNPFEMLANGLLDKGKSNEAVTYEDAIADARYSVLKKFFEIHMVVDDFDELKNGYLVREEVEGKTYLYFKKSTLDEFIKKSANKVFSNSLEAIDLLGCIRVDYYKNQKNIWKVEAPDFMNKEKTIHKKETNTQQTLTELDDAYHAQQFRTPK
jgi:hypothetical protein